MRIFIILVSLLLIITGCEEQTQQPDNNKDPKKITQETNSNLTTTFFSEGHEFRGIEGKIGFLNLKLKSKVPQKILWHFWGKSEQITGTFKLEGIQLLKGDKVPLLIDRNTNKKVWESPQAYTQPNIGAIKTMPSTVLFDNPGIWKLIIYIDNKIFAELTVEVK